MRKLILLFFCIFTTSVYGKGMYGQKHLSAGLHAGVTTFWKAPDSANYIGYYISADVFNFVIAYGSAGKHKGENVYGSGGVSNDYRLSSVTLGYNFYIKCTEKIDVVLTPLAGFCSTKRLYNDSYYESDVYESKQSGEFGAEVGVRIKYFVIKGGVSNKKANATIGFCYHF